MINCQKIDQIPTDLHNSFIDILERQEDRQTHTHTQKERYRNRDRYKSSKCLGCVLSSFIEGRVISQR